MNIALPRMWTLGALMICASALGAPGSGSNSLQAVQYGTLVGDRIVVRAVFKEPLAAAPPVFRTYHPRLNILLDFPGTASAIGNNITVVKYRGLRQLEVAEIPSRTRLIIELDKPLAHDMRVKGNELWVTLEPLPVGAAYDGLRF
jgi:type IV pilus assembly protein PilQ